MKPTDICPHKLPRWKCWTCSPPTYEEMWLDHLEQYPNQWNEIHREMKQR